MIEGSEIIDDRGAVRIIERTLSDASCVYDVALSDTSPAFHPNGYRVLWHCHDEQAALDLADALEAAPSFTIEPMP